MLESYILMKMINDRVREKTKQASTNLSISLFLKYCTHGVPMIPAASATSGSSSISISTKCTFWSNSSITCQGRC